MPAVVQKSINFIEKHIYEKINEEGNHDITDFWDKCSNTSFWGVVNNYRTDDACLLWNLLSEVQ